MPHSSHRTSAESSHKHKKSHHHHRSKEHTDHTLLIPPLKQTLSTNTITRNAGSVLVPPSSNASNKSLRGTVNQGQISKPNASKKDTKQRNNSKYKKGHSCWSRFKLWLEGTQKPNVYQKPTVDPFTGKSVLTGSEVPENELKEKAETEVKCLTYSADLHNSLKYLWWTMIGKLPFRVRIEDNTLTIKMVTWSLWFVVNVITCGILWGLLIWVSVGFFLIFYNRKVEGVAIDSKDAKALDQLKAQTTEYRLLKAYWIEVWFFYTTLFHLTCVTTNQCIYGKEYMLFIKRWYKALDRSKVRVHESLQKFYLTLYALGGILVLLMTCIYASRKEFPSMYRTCQVILAGFMYPFRSRKQSERDEQGLMYFENIGLEIMIFFLYCTIVTMAWQSSVLHLTFSRCFRNGIRLMNERVRMVLLPFEEPRIGPNAVRITATYVQADYVNLTAAGMMQNKVFGFAILSDMLWTLFTLFFEIMVLTFYGFDDPAHPSFLYKSSTPFEGTTIEQLSPAFPHVLNSVGHIAITGIRLFIVIWFPDEVSRMAQVGYRYATEKGLILCETQEQRNFVRSMWLITVPKFPIHITANNFFKLTRGMICALLSAVATYYIFSMQARRELERIIVGDWAVEVRDLYYNATGIDFEKDKDNGQS